jgi:hypothetical protein
MLAAATAASIVAGNTLARILVVALTTWTPSHYRSNTTSGNFSGQEWY